MKKQKLGRNDPCSCGSGKKFKKCHGLVNAPPLPVQIRSAPVISVHQRNSGEVPREVLEKAARYFSIVQRQAQERIRLFGHILPPVAVDFGGQKIIGVGSQLLHMPTKRCKFFGDFLLAYVPQLFGREWFEAEVAKPRSERHPVMQRRVKTMTYVGAQPKLADGTYSAAMTGPLIAYLTFAYDLYVVENNDTLDPRLLRRLKHNDQFQGARHELFAEATCLRAGFRIEHEDETDPVSRHAEFTATHNATGQRVSVEAKSKHRPGVLGQAGSREPAGGLNLRIGGMLNDAVAKNPPHPLVVFMDMNMPFQSAHRLLKPGLPHPMILRTLDKMRKEHAGRDPVNAVIFTNHPGHYSGDEEPPERPHMYAQVSQLPIKAAREDALLELVQAANLYGNIPVEFPLQGGGNVDAVLERAGRQQDQVPR